MKYIAIVLIMFLMALIGAKIAYGQEAPVIISPAEGDSVSSPVVFTWQKPATSDDLYRLQVSEDPTFVIRLVNQGGITSPTHTNTLLDGLYYWRVRAAYSGQGGDWSTVQSFSVGDSPSPPPNPNPDPDPISGVEKCAVLENVALNPLDPGAANEGWQLDGSSEYINVFDPNSGDNAIIYLNTIGEARAFDCMVSNTRYIKVLDFPWQELSQGNQDFLDIYYSLPSCAPALEHRPCLLDTYEYLQNIANDANNP